MIDIGRHIARARLDSPSNAFLAFGQRALQTRDAPIDHTNKFVAPNANGISVTAQGFAERVMLRGYGFLDGAERRVAPPINRFTHHFDALFDRGHRAVGAG